MGRPRGTREPPRVHVALQSEGYAASENRVARLMKEAGLRGVSRRKRPSTTVQGERSHSIPDLVDRDFTTESPNELWVADITYVPTKAGFLYLAVALDAFNRRVVGRGMAGHLCAKLVLDALDMAGKQRNPEETIRHSDQGTPCTAIDFGQRCRAEGVGPSMGSQGDCYDNAMCESVFATLECELIERESFSDRPEARLSVFTFIEGWYNPDRLHSALDYQSPAAYEEERLWASRGMKACDRPLYRGKSTFRGSPPNLFFPN